MQKWFEHQFFLYFLHTKSAMAALRFIVSETQKIGFCRTALNFSWRQKMGFHSSPMNHFAEQASQWLGDGGPFCSLLKSRSVISFNGPDTVKFLQGLLTNDLRRFGEQPSEHIATIPTPNMPLVSAPPMYAAMLTPQGRFLYDLFIYRPTHSDEKLDRTGSGPGSDSNQLPALFADVDALFLDELLECFKKYRLRAKIEIENVSKEFSCWQRFGGNLSKKSSSEEPDASAVGWGGGVDHAGISAAQGNNLGWRWFKDPRLDSLGFRGIFPSNTTPPLVESDKEVDERYYLLWRLEKGVAEGSVEIPKGEAVPLEYNLTGLNAISFDKGCYVGQELIARTYHRGVIRKRLLPMIFVDKGGKEVDKVAPGAEVVDVTSGKKAGTVTTALGCSGMGLLRLEEAFKGSDQLGIKGQEEVKVRVSRPDWWPSEWGQEHEQNTSVA